VSTLNQAVIDLLDQRITGTDIADIGEERGHRMLARGRQPRLARERCPMCSYSPI
jgi:hypothetical protein